MNKPLTIAILFMFEVIGTAMLNIIPVVEENNLFSDINQQLQDAIDKVFTSINLNEKFIGQNETRLLLSTIASLKQISEDKYKIFDEVANASTLDLIYNNLKNSSLFKLDKPINEIMAEDFNVKYNSSKKKNNNIKFSMNSIEIPDDSDEAIVLLRNYLFNVNNVELVDIVKPSRKIKEMYEKHKQFNYAKKKHLKVWKPSNSTEFLKLSARRLYKGNQARIKKFPFIASVHVKGKLVGTGAVLSRNMIITAASCLHEASYNSKYLKDRHHAINVRVGSDYPDRFGEWIEATNVFIHPEYESATLTNNIAILQIKKHLHLRKKSRKIRRIEFQRMKGGLPNFVREVILLGWGDKGDQKGLSYSHLKISKYEDCADIYSKYVTKNNFCAGYSGHGAGACQRDIGGPAIVSNVLVGVVSFGPPVCGAPHSPTVFTNIGNYVTWIENIVEGTPERMTPTPPRSLMLQPPNGYSTNQISRPPFDSDIKNSKAGYPQSINVFSNILREIMINGGQMAQNALNMSPFGNIWNTTRSTTTKASTKQHYNNHDLVRPFNINDYTTTRATGVTPPTSRRPANNGDFQIKPYDFFTRHKNISMATNRQYPFLSSSMLPNERYQYLSSSILPNERYQYLSSSMLPNQRYQFLTSSVLPDPQYPFLSSSMLPNLRYPFLTSSMLPNSRYPFLTSTLPNQQYPFPTPSMLPNQQYTFPKPNILRYVTEASTIKSPGPEDSTSDSDNYESGEEDGLEIEMPQTDLPSIRPPKMALNEPEQYNMQMLPFRPNRDVYLSRSTVKDSLELIKYFIKNKLAPVGSQLNLPVNDFETKAEDFLIQNYVKDRLNTMNRPKSMLKTLSSPSYLDHGISFEEESEKFLGKNYLKNHRQEKDLSDEFVLLLLKHTTIRNKKYRYTVTDNFGRKDDDFINAFPSLLRTTKHMKRFIPTVSDPEEVFIIKDLQNPTVGASRNFNNKNKLFQSLQREDKELQDILSLIKYPNQYLKLRNSAKMEKPLKLQKRQFTKVPYVENRAKQKEAVTQKRPSVVRILKSAPQIDYTEFIYKKVLSKVLTTRNLTTNGSSARTDNKNPIERNSNNNLKIIASKLDSLIKEFEALNQTENLRAQNESNVASNHNFSSPEDLYTEDDIDKSGQRRRSFLDYIDLS